MLLSGGHVLVMPSFSVKNVVLLGSDTKRTHCSFIKIHVRTWHSTESQATEGKLHTMCLLANKQEKITST